MDEFIYIRTNDWWKSKQLIKLGQSDKPIQRECNYVTCEPDRGEFLKIFKEHLKKHNTKISSA